MKRVFSRRAVAASALLGLSAWGFFPSVAQAAPATRLVLAVRGEPERGFDPIKGWGEYGNPLFQSTLLKLDAKLNLVGDLASKWHISPDGKVWTITLRENVKFADGKPVTAEDVAFTLETGRKADALVDLTNLESVKAIDGKTVQLRLKTPQVTFSHQLSTIGIVPKHAYGERYAEAPLGSGPFKLVSWQKGQQLIVEPNPHYYGKKPAFERITFLFTQEDASVAAAHNGQVHVAAVPPAFADRVPAAMQRVAVKSVDNRGIMFPTAPATGKKNGRWLRFGE